MSEPEQLEDGPGALPGDAVGRLDPLAHPAVSSSPDVTPEDAALDVELRLMNKRKWRRAHVGMGELICPLCGSKVADEHRSRAQHIEWHKESERVRAVTGQAPLPVVLGLDYARLHERAVRNHAITLGVGLVVVLVLAVVIVALTV